MADQNNTQIAPLTALINPFQFSDHDIRTAVDEHSEAWFCAKDVCSALDIKWSGRRNTLGSLLDKWVMVSYYETIKGERDTLFINEASVYKLAFCSRKPKAMAFCNWVCEEVLSALRKNGFYGIIDAGHRLSYSKQIIDVTTRLSTAKDALLVKVLHDELRDLYNLIGRKMPDIALLGMVYKQLDLFQEGALHV